MLILKFFRPLVILSHRTVIMRFTIGILLLGVAFARREICGKNARFTQCGIACPLTCDNIDNPPDFCSAVCIQGCQCEEGFILSRTLGCVKPEDCEKTAKVPPLTVVIKDDQGQKLEGLAGPYNEGDYLFLICEAEGGNQDLIVTWWRNGVLIDNTFSLDPQRHSARNELKILNLKRSDFMVEHTCQAISESHKKSINSSVKIDLNLKPVYVRITTERKPVNLGEDLTLDCETSGSRPEANIVWWIDDEFIQNENQSFFSRSGGSEGNVTYSSIHLKPSIGDNGKVVTCIAENPLLPQIDIKDTWILNIHYNVCGKNERYNECGTHCPLTCKNYEIPDRQCPDVCDEGCECEIGFVRRADNRCVRPKDCPKEQGKIPEVNCNDCPDPGECEAVLTRFYYDSEEERCKEFIYGGCGGNANNFETEEDCKTTCRNNTQD